MHSHINQQTKKTMRGQQENLRMGEESFISETGGLQKLPGSASLKKTRAGKISQVVTMETYGVLHLLVS